MRHLSLDSEPTQIIQDDLLISKSLITSTETLLSNKVTFLGFENQYMDIFWGITIQPNPGGKSEFGIT